MERPWSITWIILTSPICVWIQLSGTTCHVTETTLSHGQSIFDSYRKLCSKLYFKAEAQQIDRILQVFAQRYWKCNPESIFGNPGTCVCVCVFHQSNL